MNATARDPLAPVPARLPWRAGIGLRDVHHEEFLAQRPRAAWLEAHTENYFGNASRVLETLRVDYPISLHGVGMSLGSADGLDPRHLDKVAALVARVEPALVSEHVCWGAIGGRHTNDLLPLPMTDEALDLMVRRVDEVQEALGREIAVENVSSYVAFAEASMPEWTFLSELARRSGCSLLLDVNNVYVNAINHGFDAFEYIDSVPAECVAELHLAGHSKQQRNGKQFLIDTHDSRIAADVWALYAHAVSRLGAVPTLIEWDSALPPVSVLLEQALLADRIVEFVHARAA